VIINEEILHSSTELCFCPVNDNLVSIFAKKMYFAKNVDIHFYLMNCHSDWTNSTLHLC